MAEGMVPGDLKMKTVHVTFIFKKGQKSSPMNYQPVSLTFVSGKIMEKGVPDVPSEEKLTN